MKLSSNFSLKELTRSQTAIRHGIDNSPDTSQLVCLTALTTAVLQPIREVHGRVNINSALRVLDLNRKIGSGDSSQHILGMAADLECPSIDNLQLAKWIEQTLTFDQVILEFYEQGEPTSGWIHVSYNNAGENRGRVLTASRIDGKTQYTEGIHE
jgi:uncharacterized protein YcbK (DUF882 family)